MRKNQNRKQALTEKNFLLSELRTNKFFFGQRNNILLYTEEKSEDPRITKLGLEINFGIIPRKSENMKIEKTLILTNLSSNLIKISKIYFLKTLSKKFMDCFVTKPKLSGQIIPFASKFKFQFRLDLKEMKQTRNHNETVYFSNILIVIFQILNPVQVVSKYFARKILFAIQPSRSFSYTKLSPYSRPFFPLDLKTCFDKPPIVVKFGQKPKFPYVITLRNSKRMEYNDELIRKYHNQRKNILKMEINKLNYKKIFQVLVEYEFYQLNKDMSQFDKFGVKFQIDPKNEEVSLLTVQGVSDERPPLNIGDIVKVRDSSNILHQESIGYIHNISRDVLFIKFSNLFSKNSSDKTFHVRFCLDNISYDVIIDNLLERVDLDNIIGKILFPTSEELKIEILKSKTRVRFKKISKVKFIDAELNIEQKTCVFKFLNNYCGHIPSICFGPAGAGKTRTLIELVKQLCVLYKVELSKISDGKILVVTPSDTSADLICQLLKRFVLENEIRLFRLNHWKRRYATCNINITEFMKLNRNGFFDVHPSNTMKKFDIIVTTTINCAILRNVCGFKSFKYLIFDEAAQASEPGMLLGLQFAKKGSQIIIFGDHRQLGPVVRSKTILERSLQERLMFENEIYSNTETSQYCFTMLTKNYRSHKKILEIPSKLFYKFELELLAKNVDIFTKWSNLKNKNNFPLQFYNVKSNDCQEGFSWYNSFEVNQILLIVKDLLNDKNIKVETPDLGIVAPYRKQVEKIRFILRDNNLGAIDVGTCGDYQGKEKKIIIISTVRTILSSKYSKDLGLIFNDKKFNVTLSRASCLLIVVGDAILLLLDKNWKHFIKFCYENKNYVGEIPSMLLAFGEDNDSFEGETIVREVLKKLNIDTLEEDGNWRLMI